MSHFMSFLIKACTKDGDTKNLHPDTKACMSLYFFSLLFRTVQHRRLLKQLPDKADGKDASSDADKKKKEATKHPTAVINFGTGVRWVLTDMINVKTRVSNIVTSCFSAWTMDWIPFPCLPPRTRPRSKPRKFPKVHFYLLLHTL